MKISKLPELGKIHREFFDRVIFPQLGVANEHIVIGPRHGVDYGVLRLGDKYLALSTDPFFIVPQYGFSRAAWFGFHIIMSDVAVSGLEPKYLAIDLNLPPEINEEQLEEMWKAVHLESLKYGISVITGHTARYTGCNYPMVGGATGFAVGDEHDLRGPHRVEIGDHIVVTKGPAVETTGLLAVSFPHKFVEAGGTDFQREAENIFYQMSVLDDCAVAREFPGVHVMHDATEYGLWGGLYEMAQAGKFGMNIFHADIPVQPVIQKTAELFAFDPFSAISEGTLILTVDAKESSDLVKAFEEKGILSSIIGEVIHESMGLKIQRDGSEKTLEFPEVDPYWILAAELSK
jgi:hydrogenase maturation factor